jgi:sugar phosphate isomerase/epimerase
VLVVHGSGPLDGLPPAPARGRALEGVAELAADAQAAGVVLAVENLPDNFLPSSGEDVRRFVDEIGHPSVRACLDTGHAHLTDGVVTATRALSDRIASIHAHDNAGRADDHLLPGAGSVDWPSFGGALREVGYAGPVVLELALPKGETPASMVEAFWSAVDT